jgi:SAM-dependent methyltransferase
MLKKITQALARSVADSILLSRGKRLWEQNESNWNLPLTRAEKVLSGVYLILSHYSNGRFPPTFGDQQKVYEIERALPKKPGVELEATRDIGRRKPYWYNRWGPIYLEDFARLVRSLQNLGIAPPAKILEIGCGAGWASEFLAQMHFDVVGTTINPMDIEDAQARVGALKARGVQVKLQYICAPMEEVHEATTGAGPFDVVFVYEALHHAYDWTIACEQAYRCLKPGGWFIVCNEPNLVHTLVAYRVSQISKYPEIGFRKGSLFAELKRIGFRNRVVLAKRFGFFCRGIWVAVQRPTVQGER